MYVSTGRRKITRRKEKETYALAQLFTPLFKLKFEIYGGREKNGPLKKERESLLSLQYIHEEIKENVGKYVN